MSPELHKKKLVSVGNYLFTGKTLGKGNFARVEEAVHTILNVKVAIKIIDINHIKEEYVVKNLYREAKIMAKLNHPCIACIFQTMQRSDNVYYLVAEVASGGDLCTFVKKQVYGKLAEKQTKIFARQFSSAFSHMHNLKIVHRDLKMENVMLNSVQTQIKIVDFGLSNFWSSDSPLRTHCGSPEYAAPELFITGKKYGPEVDLWSFGIILYGMVLGQLPFVTNRSKQLASAERRKELVAQIHKGLSTSHRRALAVFTPEFRSLMSRLLVADSSKRITTKELTVHPWITDKGKRIICSSPLKNLESYERGKIISKINSVLQIDPKILNSTMLQDPFGKIGGMFNILKRRYQLSQINGDGTSRTIPSLTIFELANLTKSLERERVASPKGRLSKTSQPAIKKPQSAQTQTKNSDFSPRVSLNEGLRTKQSNPSTEKEKIKSAKIMKKWSKVRPSTMQDHILEKIDESTRPSSLKPVAHTKSSPIDYRNIKSPCLRRKVYAATLAQKISSPLAKDSKQKDISLPPVKTPKKSEAPSGAPMPNTSVPDTRHTKTPTTCKSTESSPKKNAKDKEQKERRKSSDLKVPKKQISESDAIVQTSTKTTKLPTYLNKEISLRPPENTASKSEYRTRRRPTTGPLHEILQTSLKTAEAGVTAAGSSKSSRQYPGIPKIENSSKDANERTEEGWERSHMAFGDFVNRSSSSPAGHGRKFAIYDPIARSIADYVTNNVTNKVYNNYTWLKK